MPRNITPETLATLRARICKIVNGGRGPSKRRRAMLDAIQALEARIAELEAEAQ